MAVAENVAKALVARNVRVSGFVQEPVVENDERIGHRLRRLNRDERVPVARRGGEPRSDHEESFCGYVFDRVAFDAAKRWLNEDLAACEVVVIDEVSKLEVAGRGHHDALVQALDSGKLVVMSVRADQLFFAVERFALEEPVAVLDVTESSEADPIPAFVDEILRALSNP